MTLNELDTNQNACIIKVYDKRLVEMGLAGGTNVFKVREAPLKGSAIYKMWNNLLIIQDERAKKVMVELL